MTRLTQAHRWRWNRQQRRAAVAIAGALVGPSGIWHVPHVMHMRTLERGYALAGRMRRDEMAMERRRPRITMAFTQWEKKR
jgi:hypothetical protein